MTRAERLPGLAAVARRAPWGILALDALGIALALGAALVAGEGRPDRHFREGGLVTWLNTLQLVAAGGVSLAILAARRRAAPPERSGALFWLIVAAGSLYLALDELLVVHEQFGKYLRVVLHVSLQPLKTSDLFLLGYGLGALSVCLLYRRELRRDGHALRFFVVGAALLALSQGLDLFGPRYGTGHQWLAIVEESAKLLGFGVILGGLVERLRGARSALAAREAADQAAHASRGAWYTPP